MTDTTIANIAREKVVLDNTEWFEGEDGAGSFKSRIQSIRGTGEVPVTTSAVPLDVGPDEQLASVTTSGSGLGTDLVNLANPTLDANGFNGDRLGQSVIISYAHQTDPGDILLISVAGMSDGIGLLDGIIGANTVGNIRLTTEGEYALFSWTGRAWALNYSVSQFVGALTFVGVQIGGNGDGGGNNTLAGNQGTDSLAGSAYLRGGDATLSGDGGNAVMQGGFALDTGNGGNALIDAGAGVSNGHILVGTQVALPTADPHVLGALWNSSGVLHISAGP